MTIAKSKTVLFVNGAWMNSACWDNLRSPFEAAGYSVHTLEWPSLEGDPATLRKAPPKAAGSLTVQNIVEHYANYIRGLPEQPIIIGHSFGGLFAQILLDKGYGTAGVALDPAPIAGVIPSTTSLAGAAPILFRINGWNRAFTLSEASLRRNFANTAPPALQNTAYDRLVVPTSGRIFYQAASWIGTSVKPKRRQQPLLITSAEKDRTVSPIVARQAYRIQKRSGARTDFQTFDGMSHFLIEEPGWERVADATFKWVEGL